MKVKTDFTNNYKLANKRRKSVEKLWTWFTAYNYLVNVFKIFTRELRLAAPGRFNCVSPNVKKNLSNT